MFYKELNEEIKKKYGDEFFEMCKLHQIDPKEDEEALILVEDGEGGFYWAINPYYEWF